MTGGFGPLAVELLYLLCAVCALALGGWLLARRKERGPAVVTKAVALALTASWALAFAELGAAHIATAALLNLTHLAWLLTLYRLFAPDERDKSVGPIRPVVLALAFVELMQLVLLAGRAEHAGVPDAQDTIVGFEVTFRLLFCVGALVLVHNLYAGASAQAREALRWPAAALAVMWLYDLNLSTVAYLGQRLPVDLVVLRGGATLAAVALLAIGSLRHEGALRFSPSRSFAFRSFSLLIIGGYLVVMVLVAQGLAYIGSDLARLVLTSDLNRLLGLEGCLSGNVPDTKKGRAALAKLPPACRELARTKPAKVVRPWCCRCHRRSAGAFRSGTSRTGSCGARDPA